MRQLYYKVEKELLQNRAASRYYKVGQELLQSGTGNLLQSGAIIIAKWDSFMTKWGSYSKVGQLLGQFIFVTSHPLSGPLNLPLQSFKN